MYDNVQTTDYGHNELIIPLSLYMNRIRKSTFGLRFDQLADLFAVVVKDQASSDVNSAEENLAEILCSELTEVMPGRSLLFPTVTEVSASQQGSMITLAEQSLQQILFSPDSSINVPLEYVSDQPGACKNPIHQPRHKVPTVQKLF